MVAKRRITSTALWAVLVLAFAIPVWGQSSAIVGDPETGLNAHAEFVIRFETEKAGMSSIEYGLDGELTFETDEIIALGAIHEHVLLDVQAGAVYSYRIHAHDWSGWEASTDIMTFQVPEMSAPTGLQSRAATLMWDKSFGATEYRVERAEQSGGPYETVGIVQEPQFADEDVDEDMEYHYVVYAIDVHGDAFGPSEELSAVMVERHFIELGAHAVAAGLNHLDWEDGLSEATVVDGRDALRLIENPLTPPRYLYFDVEDDLFFNANVTVEIVVEYRSDVSGSLQLHYDAADPASGPVDGAFTSAVVTGSTSTSAQITPTDEWQQVRFTLANARFAGRQNAGADFRLSASEGLDLVIARLEMVVKEIVD